MQSALTWSKHMRSLLARFALFGAGIAVVVSCDAGVPTAAGSRSGNKGGTTGANTGLHITIDTPSVGSLVNVGDSLYVHVHATGGSLGLKDVTIVGYKVSGSVDLGTYKQTARYSAVDVPLDGATKDTTLRRYLQPVQPVDTTVDSLIVRAYATDSAGNVAQDSVRVFMVTGPHVGIIDPPAGDQESAGILLSLSAYAAQKDGVASMSFHIRNNGSWPTPVDTTITTNFTSPKPDTSWFTTTWLIRKDAPINGTFTIVASAIDVNRNPGQSAPVTVMIKGQTASPPRVYQTVPPKMETSDAITVTAKGDAGIRFVGYVVRDSVGTLIKRDSIDLSPAPYSTPRTVSVPVTLPQTQQGRELRFVSFAYDEVGRIGYSVPATATQAVAVESQAHVDSSLIVYGRTYRLPRPGVIADLAVDATRGDVFLSNLDYNLVEVWQHDATTAGPALSFVPNGIAVGSQPWGLFLANDTLLVANSGATTISRVLLGAPGTAPPATEALASRIRTRNSYIFTFTYTRDQNTQQVRLVPGKVYGFSDRPEYVAESNGGRIYFSTRPTSFAPEGTVRWMDPKLPSPDSRQVWQYAKTLASQSSLTYAVFNVDSAAILSAPPNSGRSDILVLWDHPYGQTTGNIQVADSVPENAFAALQAQGSDVEAATNLDLSDLALTDTTYEAASTDRKWIAFGEGNLSARAVARVFMVHDSSSADQGPEFLTPSIQVTDLQQNASETVFGIAVDSIGRQVAAHGSMSYFAAVDDPFTLRLEGEYDSFDNGAGIAFAPGAKGPAPAVPYTPPYNNRLAFAATKSGVIQAIDVAYFNNRGTFTTKGNLYGPLRVSGPMPGDPPDVIYKLYGLSSNGLVVIDLTANDILAGH